MMFIWKKLRFKELIYKKNIIPYLFLIPSSIFLFIFTYYPIFRSIYYSLFNYNLWMPQPQFIGLDNYKYIIRDELFYEIIQNNFAYLIGTIPIIIIFSLFLAILINERSKFSNFYKTSIFAPTLFPMAAAAMLWVFMYNPDIGLLNKLLRTFGVSGMTWINNSRTALSSLMIVMIWKNLGYFVILFLAGLQNINQSLYESANIGGANWFQKHIYITLPLISPTLLFVMIVNIIESFRVFDIVHIMTQGGPANSTNVFVYYIYQQAFRYWDLGIGNALTTIMILVLFITIIFVMKSLNKYVQFG